MRSAGLDVAALTDSVGFAITEKLRDAIDLLNTVPKGVWTPALDADGGVREGGDVADLTGLIDKDVVVKWPAGMRVIVRRERPHPGAQLSLFEERDGWRYQAFVTNTTTERFNPLIESFNGRLRDECLNIHLFWSLARTRVTIDDWKEEYNHDRPHSSLGYLAPRAYPAACTH